MRRAGREGLERAFQATTYAVGTLRLRIGETSAPLDALLARRGVQEWAYLTAWNPASRTRSRDENERAQARLAAELHARGLEALEGEALADDGAWPPEPSLLVLGLSRDDAMALGRAFGQDAIVAGRQGGAAELVWLA